MVMVGLLVVVSVVVSRICEKVGCIVFFLWLMMFVFL